MANVGGGILYEKAKDNRAQESHTGKKSSHVGMGCLKQLFEGGQEMGWKKFVNSVSSESTFAFDNLVLWSPPYTAMTTGSRNCKSPT